MNCEYCEHKMNIKFIDIIFKKEIWKCNNCKLIKIYPLQNRSLEFIIKSLKSDEK